MQNRIEELARKARALATTKDAFEEYVVYFDAEKFEQEFAKLLIKECIKTVKEVQPGYKDYRSQIEEAMQDDCVEAIKHYFEIKE